ncbi:TPA: DUF4410 domain-containing protein [Neisseria lactamica]
MKKLLALTASVLALSACSTTSTVDFSQKEKSYRSYTIRDLSQDHIPSDTRALFIQNLNHELAALGYAVGDDLDVNVNIENFNEGNRALRYLVGFGAGKATSKIVTTLVDKESGKIVGHIQTDGMLAMGAFGGNSGDILKRSAKDIAKKIAESGILKKEK